jgi:hypothetical protein
LATVVVENVLFYFIGVQQLRANFYFSGEDRELDELKS